jgi:hypothetical protein
MDLWCTRRDFLKYAGAAGGTALMGNYPLPAKGENVSRVSLVNTADRREGVKSSLKTLGINPAKGKDVLIKPNFNTADVTPGSTHNDTLVALVDELWAMGAKTVSLGERSYPLTREVMEAKGILPFMKKLQVKVIDFDSLPDKDWILNPGKATGEMAFASPVQCSMQNAWSQPAASRRTSMAERSPCLSSFTWALFPPHATVTRICRNCTVRPTRDS